MMDSSLHMGPVILLFIAAAGWFAAARTAMGALGGKSASPGRKALAYSLSNAILMLIALYIGKPVIAVEIIFGSCVACLTLVLGVIVSGASHTRVGSRRRIGALVLPAGLIY